MKDILQLLPLVTLRLGEHGEICSGEGTAGENACSLYGLAYSKKHAFLLRYQNKINLSAGKIVEKQIG